MAKTKLEARIEKLAGLKSSELPWNESPGVTARIARQAERIPTYKYGLVLYGYGRTNCIILNLSMYGAKISLSGGVNLPPTVRLLIPQQGISYDAAVAWQKGPEAGLKFLDV